MSVALCPFFVCARTSACAPDIAVSFQYYTFFPEILGHSLSKDDVHGHNIYMNVQLS